LVECFLVSTASGFWRGRVPPGYFVGAGESAHNVAAVPPTRVGVVDYRELARAFDLVEETGGLGEESPVLGDRARRDPGLLGYGAYAEAIRRS
jgi:hypothetical protein